MQVIQVWNAIHKQIGIACSVGLYKLIRHPGHPNLNLTTVVYVVALCPVEHASHTRDLGSNPV